MWSAERLKCPQSGRNGFQSASLTMSPPLALRHLEWRERVKSLSRVQLPATPWTVAYQAPPSVGFSKQEYWRGCHFLLQGHLERTPHLPAAQSRTRLKRLSSSSSSMILLGSLYCTGDLKVPASLTWPLKKQCSGPCQWLNGDTAA